MCVDKNVTTLSVCAQLQPGNRICTRKKTLCRTLRQFISNNKEKSFWLKGLLSLFGSLNCSFCFSLETQRIMVSNRHLIFKLMPLDMAILTLNGANKQVDLADKGALKLLHNDYEPSFQSLFARSNSFTIHEKNLQRSQVFFIRNWFIRNYYYDGQNFKKL